MVAHFQRAFTKEELGVVRRQVGIGIEERALSAANEIFSFLQRIDATLGPIGTNEG
jgi:hypothetical protein